MAIESKNNKYFSQKVQEFAHKKRLPIKAMFELTYHCNFRCIHCYNIDEQKRTETQDELKTKEVLSILNQLAEMGTLYLLFTGGEMFCRKDILDIVGYAKRLGFQIELLTNGSFIDEKIADEIMRIRPGRVTISVHAMDKGISERITQAPGSHKKVFKAVRLLHERKIPLSIKSCGLQENKDEIIKISRFAQRLNMLYQLDDDLLRRRGGSEVPLEHSILPEEKYVLRQACYPMLFARVDEKGALRKVEKFKQSSEALFYCGAGKTVLAINPFGELNLCLEIDYPKYRILEGSLKEGWQVIKDLVDNLAPPKDWPCRNCDLSKYCGWCPSKSFLKDGTFTSCDPYLRRDAEFRRKIKQGMNGYTSKKTIF